MALTGSGTQTLARVSVDPRRWIVLLSFAICNMNQCFCNMTFSSLQQDTLQAYFGNGMNKATTDMLMNWGPVFGTLCFPIAVWISSQHNGLRKTLWCGVVLTLLGAMIRMIPIVVRSISGSEDATQETWAYVCYHTGQSLVAAAGPFNMGAVTLLSVVWFPESERTLATSIAQVSNGAGATVAYLNPLWLVMSSSDIPNMFYFSFILAVIPLVSALAYLPARPKYFPSAAAQAAAGALDACSESNLSGEKCRSLLANRSFIVLSLAIGVWEGATIGWTSLFQPMFGPVGISESTVAWMGFANSVGTNIAGIAAGGAIDLFFRRRLKAGILFGAFGNLFCIAWFMFSLPCCGVEAPNSILPRSDVSMTVVLTFAGIFQGVMEPLCYELCAELMYPAKESTSAGILVLLLNIIAGMMIGANTVLDAAYMNYIMNAVALAVVLSILFGVKEEYKRPINEELDMNESLQTHGRLDHLQ